MSYMARIRSFLKTNLESREHPTEVDCGYQTVTRATGEVLLQLATFGSAWIHRLNSCCGVGRDTRMPC
jgi:hypothetical protein